MSASSDIDSSPASYSQQHFGEDDQNKSNKSIIVGELLTDESNGLGDSLESADIDGSDNILDIAKNTKDISCANSDVLVSGEWRHDSSECTDETEGKEMDHYEYEESLDVATELSEHRDSYSDDAGDDSKSHRDYRVIAKERYHKMLDFEETESDGTDGRAYDYDLSSEEGYDEKQYHAARGDRKEENYSSYNVSIDHSELESESKLDHEQSSLDHNAAKDESLNQDVSIASTESGVVAPMSTSSPESEAKQSEDVYSSNFEDADSASLAPTVSSEGIAVSYDGLNISVPHATDRAVTPVGIHDDDCHGANAAARSIASDTVYAALAGNTNCSSRNNSEEIGLDFAAIAPGTTGMPQNATLFTDGDLQTMSATSSELIGSNPVPVTIAATTTAAPAHIVAAATAPAPILTAAAAPVFEVSESPQTQKIRRLIDEELSRAVFVRAETGARTPAGLIPDAQEKQVSREASAGALSRVSHGDSEASYSVSAASSIAAGTRRSEPPSEVVPVMNIADIVRDVMSRHQGDKKAGSRVSALSSNHLPAFPGRRKRFVEDEAGRISRIMLGQGLGK
jgi:hypothetical protein